VRTVFDKPLNPESTGSHTSGVGILKRYGLLSISGTAEAEKVMAVILGRAHADIAVTNATVLNVYTGECLEGLTVTTKDRWIAHIGEDPGARISKKTDVIDAGGKILIPGFIDGHTHLADMIYTPSEFIRHAAPGGTTAVITETIEPYPICGREGIEDFLSALEDQPISFFSTVPAMASNCSAMNGISMEDLENLLQRDDILGLGEAYWSSVLQKPDIFLPLLEKTLRSGKTTEGHSAGASREKLMAYCALGVSSCHEPIRAEEVLERLRMGLHVMVREGSIRQDLKEISEIRHTGVDLRRLILVTDGVEPADLLEKGYMESIVQKAVDCGFEPAQAIRMATLTVAEYFQLEGLLGGLAPGKQADMVLIPDLRTIRAEMVFAKGSIIAENGRLAVSPREHSFSYASRKSIRLSSEMKPEDFLIRAPEDAEEMKVRVIDQVTHLVTREHLTNVVVVDGKIPSDVGRDLLKVAAIDRALSPGRIFVGLIKGFQLRSGAFACSSGWDSADIMVVGANDRDMALAVNRIHELQGGLVVCENGRIVSEFPMNIFGLLSDLPLPEIAGRMKTATTAINELGCPFDNPYRTLVTLAGSAIPFIRICDEGLVELKTGSRLGLFVE
jgi:adenine deaminase